MLPAELAEHQIGQVDVLMAMYPGEDEATLDAESEVLLSDLRTGIDDGLMPEFTKPPTVTVLLTLSVPDSADPAAGSKALQLDINVPFWSEGEETPDEAPRIRVRIRQPSWLNRASTAHLNSQVPEDDEDLFSTIEAIQEAAARHLEEARQLAEASTQESRGDDGPLVRVWFYFPSISTRSKRDDFIINAPLYRLTGFLYAGKPGLLCVEGDSQQIDDYMKFIKTESWGDIPAHHKKVSERHREKDIAARVFRDMEEITDSVGERRGQRANRGDMKAIEAWLVERGLGDAFAKVLM